MTVMKWYAQDEVNQEESEQNEVDEMKKGADSNGKVMHIPATINMHLCEWISNNDEDAAVHVSHLFVCYTKSGGRAV